VGQDADADRLRVAAIRRIANSAIQKNTRANRYRRETMFRYTND
jgi:hypothetical protein